MTPCLHSHVFINDDDRYCCNIINKSWYKRRKKTHAWWRNITIPNDFVYVTQVFKVNFSLRIWKWLRPNKIPLKVLIRWPKRYTYWTRNDILKSTNGNYNGHCRCTLLLWCCRTRLTQVVAKKSDGAFAHGYNVRFFLLFLNSYHFAWFFNEIFHRTTSYKRMMKNFTKLNYTVKLESISSFTFFFVCLD